MGAAGVLAYRPVRASTSKPTNPMQNGRQRPYRCRGVVSAPLSSARRHELDIPEACCEGPQGVTWGARWCSTGAAPDFRAPSARTGAGRRRRRCRGSAPCFPASYARAGADRPGCCPCACRRAPPRSAAGCGCRRPPDQGDPAINEAPVLPRGEVLASPAATREQPVARSQPPGLQPSRERLARRLGELERHRPAGVLLRDGGAEPDRVAQMDVGHAQADEVAAAQLAVPAGP